MVILVLRVLVTGSAGRIGSAVCTELAKQHLVLGLDARPSNTTDLICDITKPNIIDNALKGIDVIVHTAALHAPHVGFNHDDEFTQVNVHATQALAQRGLEHGVLHFVFTSTTALYGRASRLADTTAWITEDTPPQPITIYHHSKIAAEQSLKTLSNASGLPVTVMRLSRCFPESADVMALHRLNRGIDARDAATAHAAAVNKRLSGFKRFVVSANTVFERHQCHDLYRDAASVIKQSAPDLAQEFQARAWALPKSIDRVYDSRRAQRELAWQPKHGFTSVLQELDAGSPTVLPISI